MQILQVSNGYTQIHIVNKLYVSESKTNFFATWLTVNTLFFEFILGQFMQYMLYSYSILSKHKHEWGIVN